MQKLHNSGSRKICDYQFDKQHVQKTHKFKHKGKDKSLELFHVTEEGFL